MLNKYWMNFYSSQYCYPQFLLWLGDSRWARGLKCLHRDTSNEDSGSSGNEQYLDPRAPYLPRRSECTPTLGFPIPGTIQRGKASRSDLTENPWAWDIAGGAGICRPCFLFCLCIYLDVVLPNHSTPPILLSLSLTS